MGRFKKLGRAVKKIFRGRRRVAPKRRRAVGKPTGHLTIKKTVLDDRITVLNSTNSFGVDTFELADIPQYADYIKLYEEYRIDKIVYSFKSLNNTSQHNATTGAITTLGMIHTNVDYNDAVAPTSIQNMMNDPSYRGSRSSRNHSRTIIPKWQNVVGGSVQGQSKTGFLNCFNQDGVTVSTVSHYGLKWCFEGGLSNASVTGTVASFLIEPIITYYVSFRNPK